MEGRPSAAELKHLCPEIPIAFLEAYLEGFGQRYFESFERADLLAHVRALASLSATRLCTLIFRDVGDPRADVPMQAEITVVAFNYTGEFALITGLLAASGFDIGSGDVFTSRADEHESESVRFPSRRARGPLAKEATLSGDGLDRRRIVDRFTGVLSGGGDLARLRETIEERLTSLLALLERGDAESRARARQKLYEGVVQALTDVPEPGAYLFPVEIQTELSPEGATRLKVFSEDTPFFLFSLSNALALHDVSIEHVQIRTMGTRVEDEIDFVDAHGKALTDAGALNQIKLSVLFTKQFTYFLGKAADPYAALLRFESITEEILSASEEGSWLRLLSNPRILEDLAKLLGTSDFLWEDFIRGQYETLLPMLAPSVRQGSLSHPEGELAPLLDAELAKAATLEEKRRILNRFKDNESYLIDLDHLVTPGVDFLTLSRKLTALAEAVVNAAVRLIWNGLAARYGLPRSFAGLPAQHAILGLGKLGGQALGYASDIELLFVYSDSGETDGSEKIANREFFEYLFKEAVNLIETKREGIFHVDLRLRPYGRNTPIAVSLDTFCRYYGPGGEAMSYEKLALVRMRAIGGDLEFAHLVERLRDDMVYESASISLADLRELREKQLAAMTSPGRLNAKFSPGALVDLEYSVQIIQCMFGKDDPQLRTPQIHAALDQLVRTGHLSGEEANDLVEAYHFLRRLINGLRVLRGSAKDLFLPPADSDEYVHLARRMGYAKQFGLTPAQLLHLEFETRTATVRSFVERHLGRGSLPGPPVGNVADLVLAEDPPPALRGRILAEGGFTNPERAYANLRFIAGEGKRRMLFARLAVLAWEYLVASPDPDMALNNWERYVGSIPDPEAHFSRLLDQPKRLEVLLAIFSGSQFLADELVRNPETFSWVSSPAMIGSVRTREAMLSDLRSLAASSPDRQAWRAAVRRFRRREILRIGTRDLCLGTPMPEIVLELSNLAETIIQGAVERIEADSEVTELCAAAGFCVLAFGKLGGRELNYSSDIDLLGVYSTGGEREARVCSSVMEQLRADLSDHTPEGYVYRVDLRLRPYGRSGPLVQTLPALLTYYRESASLWEFQALLKLRPVGGSHETGERLLEELRPLLLRDWSGGEVADSIVRLRRSAENASAGNNGATDSPSTNGFAGGTNGAGAAAANGSGAVRSEASIELSGPIDVKNGPGGIRDIEFLLQGIQLVEGKDHPRIVTGNTIEGLRALAAAGLLPVASADELLSDYLFLRRIEHFLQLYDDRQIHAIPEGERERAALARRIEGRRAVAEQFLGRLEATLKRVRASYDEGLEQLRRKRYPDAGGG